LLPDDNDNLLISATQNGVQGFPRVFGFFPVIKQNGRPPSLQFFGKNQKGNGGLATTTKTMELINLIESNDCNFSIFRMGRSESIN
jgi:hypothetical protein